MQKLPYGKMKNCTINKKERMYQKSRFGRVFPSSCLFFFMKD